jgi:uncharacterized protein
MSIPEPIRKASYVNLITTKRDGTKVSTPVWFAIDTNNELLMYSEKHAGKMKRIRNNASVEIVPATVRGKAIGVAVAATARELPESDGPRVHEALNRKYGWKKKVVDLFSTIGSTLLPKKRQPEGFIAIALSEK